jgi:hypothetical protein
MSRTMHNCVGSGTIAVLIMRANGARRFGPDFIVWFWKKM